MKLRFNTPSIFVFIISLLWIFPLNAQKKDSFKALDLQAKEYFRVEEFREALPLYLKLDSLKPNSPYVNARVGICYLNSEFKFKSLPYLEKATNAGYNKDHIDFYLGRAYHLNHEFDKAIASYEHSKKGLNAKKSEDLVSIKRVDRLIEMCNSGKELVKDTINVKIENIGGNINSPYPEYAPVISADETVLIFTSRRPSTTGGLKDETGQYFEDIYMSVKEDDKWGEPVNIGSNINTSGHDASIGLSPDGQELLIYKHEGGGDIYYSILQADKWSAPIKVPGSVNNSKTWEPSASINADEKILFFSSDREGGYGGRDIYVTRKLPNEEWALPKNLGPKINTPYDDDAPFIHPDGKTLYFSSKGHNSMGGFDIFTAVYNPENDSISDITNVGYPINTADDDIFFVWSADGTRAYFSSVRATDNYGEKDIYVLTRPKAKNVALIVLKGKVFSKTSQQPIAATITVTDNETNQIVGIYNSNSYSGKYTIIVPPGKNYGIAVEAPKHLTYSENVYIPHKDEYYEMHKDIILEPLEDGSVTVLKNVFFDSGSSDLREESHIELDKFYKILSENPTLHIEIAGHTDDVGNDQDNLELSQRRSMSVVKYLSDKGIDPKRLCAIGYGEKFNIASNNTEEGRQANRRTEIVILESLKAGQKAKDCEGFYNNQNGQELPISEANIELNQKVVTELPPVYFDFNSFNIDRTSKKNLDLWAKYLMENKNLRIEIGGHTDGKGSPAYNKILSDKRVSTVKEYLVSGGVTTDRIATASYGESKPIASNDTEAGRSKNRRVEIIILR